MQSTPRHKPPSGSTSAASTLVHTPLVHKCLVYLGDLCRYHATVSAIFPPFVHTHPHFIAGPLDPPLPPLDCLLASLPG